jgi:hypothetical protein
MLFHRAADESAAQLQRGKRKNMKNAESEVVALAGGSVVAVTLLS